MKRIAFIGIGNLGRHLAANLAAAGYPITVHNLDPDAAADLLKQGASWASKPRRAAESAGTVITCLPSPAAVSSVLVGDKGVLAGLSTGRTWIDMSTNDAKEVQRLATLAEANGISTLEAPVIGGFHKAAAGQITVLVGGHPDVYVDLLPALQAMGDPVIYMGPLGSASVIKVITNMLAFVHLVAAGEGLMLAKRAGLDLAHRLGREYGVPLPLAGLVEQIFINARTQFGGSAWSPMVVKLLEDALGTDLRAHGFPEVSSS